MALVLEQHIERKEGLRGGKPHIRGTRITVSDVAIWHLRLGHSLAEVAAYYDLPLAAVYAAIAYYFDHKAEIDREIDAGKDFYQKLKDGSFSLVKQKVQNTDSE